MMRKLTYILTIFIIFVMCGTALAAPTIIPASATSTASISSLSSASSASSVSSASSASSTTSVNGGLYSTYAQTTFINQNPDFAHPGEPVILTFNVQNVGDIGLKNVAVTVKPEYPFEQISGQPVTKSVAYLSARQQTDHSADLQFTILVDADAVAGTYNFDVTTTATTDTSDESNAQTFSSTQTIQIVVKGKEYAQIVTVNTANIDVGKVEPLEFVVTNTGSAPLKNMVVSWTDPQNLILPVYSGNTKYINYLAPNESRKVDYSVMADVNANPGLDTLVINLSYEDYQSNVQSVINKAGVFIGGDTDFDVSYSESSQGQVSISIANVGNNIAYAVKVSIPQQNGYRVTGSPSTIVGNLAKGDYTTASFNVNMTNASASTTTTPSQTGSVNTSRRFNATSVGGVNPLRVQIDYTDSVGNRIISDKSVIIPASGFTNARIVQNNSGGSNYLLYIIIIVIIIALAYWYRKRQQKKNTPAKPVESPVIVPKQ